MLCLEANLGFLPAGGSENVARLTEAATRRRTVPQTLQGSPTGGVVAGLPGLPACRDDPLSKGFELADSAECLKAGITWGAHGS